MGKSFSEGVEYYFPNGCVELKSRSGRLIAVFPGAKEWFAELLLLAEKLVATSEEGRELLKRKPVEYSYEITTGPNCSYGFRAYIFGNCIQERHNYPTLSIAHEAAKAFMKDRFNVEVINANR